jgi:hypothetical protein
MQMTDAHSTPPKNQNKKVILRYLLYISATLCAVGWFSLFVFTEQFVLAPTTLDPNSANVVPWNNHGTYHYITFRQDRIKNALIAFNVFMFICAVWLGYIDQNRK